MRHPTSRDPGFTPAGHGTRRLTGGFTLLELLVIVAIIALLVGMLMPALRSARRSSRSVHEVAAARQLMVGYLAYAYDHRGTLMPGYMNGLPTFDEEGNDLKKFPPPVAARYPWRLAPYLDYNLRGLYLDKELLERVRSLEGLETYMVSLYPSLGLNSVFVGGDADGTNADYEPEAFKPQNPWEYFYGKWYVTRLSEPRNPTRLIVFASARYAPAAGDAGDIAAGLPLVEGNFRVLPPHFRERVWELGYDVEGSPRDFGNVSLRHNFREAAIGFFDGHTGTLNEGGLQDMRHWADQATDPRWNLERIR